MQISFTTMKAITRHANFQYLQ